MGEFECHVEEIPGHSGCRMTLCGDLRVTSAMTLHQAVLGACEQFPHVEIVLCNVTALDLSAIQILLAARRETTTQVSIALLDNTDCVARWLQLAGLATAFAEQAA